MFACFPPGLGGTSELGWHGARRQREAALLEERKHLGAKHDDIQPVTQCPEAGLVLKGLGLVLQTGLTVVLITVQ